VFCNVLNQFCFIHKVPFCRQAEFQFVSK
jgi:hypothetical protein